MKGHAMFKNREFRIRVAKTNDPIEETSDTKKYPFEDPEQMNAIAKDFVRSAAITVGCVLVAATALHTISEILINSSKKNQK